MNSKQLVIITMATTLTAFSFTTAATAATAAEYGETGNKAQPVNNGHPEYLMLADNDKNKGNQNQGHKINKDKIHSDAPRLKDGRSWYNPLGWGSNSSDDDDDNDKHNNQNSNRQSDPGSTRGQERAKERRGDKDRSNDDHSWYDPRGWFK